MKNTHDSNLSWYRRAIENAGSNVKLAKYYARGKEKMEIMRQKRVELFTKICGGSTVNVLEACIAIESGKLKPFGYDLVSAYFKDNRGKMTNAHNAWLLIEAKLDNKENLALEEFPDSKIFKSNILKHMRKQHPGLVSKLKQEVGDRHYDPFKQL